MNTVKVITAELEGAALDWAVAQVESDDLDVIWKPVNGELIGFGSIGSSPEFPCVRLKIPTSAPNGLMVYSPSTDWSQGGPLIEKYKLHLHCDEPSASFIQSGMRIGYTASTVLIASCRAIVAAKMGDEVEVPEELAK